MPFLFLVLGLSAHALADDRYRLGDEWGKQAVTEEVLSRESAAFRRAALATAKVGGATGFYLGKIADRHLLATNHHVFTRSGDCSHRTVVFPLQKLAVSCVEIFGSFPQIDLAIFSVQLNEAEANLLAPVAKNFSFESELSPGQELLTIGFGIASNPERQMVANQDRDCRVFSQRGDYRLMGDPDALNPGRYQAWSFANGCDVSHGDSGSALVDRRSGDVVGIIWTGRIPKKRSIQSSAYLDSLLESNSEEIWSELSYGVPAAKIESFLKAEMESTSNATLKTLLNELLTTRN